MKRTTKVITPVEATALSAVLLMMAPKIATMFSDSAIHTALCGVRSMLDLTNVPPPGPYEISHALAQLQLLRMIVVDINCKTAAELEFLHALDLCIEIIYTADKEYMEARK